jgi:hypothetical protein
MIFRSGCGAAGRAGADRGIAVAAIAGDGTGRVGISSAAGLMDRRRFRRDPMGRGHAGATGVRRDRLRRAMGAIGVRRRMEWGRRRVDGRARSRSDHGVNLRVMIRARGSAEEPA